MGGLGALTVHIFFLQFLLFSCFMFEQRWPVIIGPFTVVLWCKSNPLPVPRFD